ncbi:hypothetical protein FQA39_LY12979 [Lamprigera yunnana]|nr:hypothetical protein FQA39_LY12979 [Lamprigera yunnana]
MSFLDPLSVIMMIAGVLSLVVSLIAGEITPPDIETIQEIKSEDYLLSLADDKKITTIVLRDGEKQEIDIEDLVPGDIVFVNAGGFIPADIRIIDNQLLRIDESVLTGENEAVSKITQSIKEDNLVLGDQKKYCFHVYFNFRRKNERNCFGTGANSEIGKIASKITSHKKEKTPLEKKVTVLTTKIVSAAISLIPESLTIIVKICLTVAAKKMARKNVIVKNPKSIETLGAVNIICSDKTDFKIQNLKTLPYKNNEEFFNCISLCSDAIISEERIVVLQN